MAYLIKCIYQPFPWAVFSLVHNDFTALREGTELEGTSINDLSHRTNLSKESQPMSFLCSHPGPGRVCNLSTLVYSCRSKRGGKGKRFCKTSERSQGFSALIPACNGNLFVDRSGEPKGFS